MNDTDYIPPYIRKSPKVNQIRMGIIGVAGSGKTHAALTFEEDYNVIVLNFDRKLPKGKNEIPFYDHDVYKKFIDPAFPGIAGTARSSLINFLKFEAPKFPLNSLFVIDSWSSVMGLLDIWHKSMERTMFWSSQKNEVDGFKIHNDRIVMAVEVTNAMKALPSNVIMTLHEQRDWDEKGNRLPDIRPFMKGQYADQMPAQLSMYLRQSHKPDKIKENKGYSWQVTPDIIFKPILPSGVEIPDGITHIPATYQAFKKYLIPQ